jgi:hypothetical protein
MTVTLLVKNCKIGKNDREQLNEVLPDTMNDAPYSRALIIDIERTAAPLYIKEAENIANR